MKKPTSQNMRKRRIIRPYLTFVVCLAGASALLAWVTRNECAVSFVQTGVARCTSFVLNLLNMQTVVVGHTIESSRFHIEVITACTGLYVASVFLPAVIAYPSRLIAKLIGATCGIAAIFALNIIRLVSLFYIGIYLPGFLEHAHLLVWQPLFIIFALFLWLFWAEKVTHASCK